MSGEKTLHGNRAKIDPKKKIEGLYVTNAVTMSRRSKDETPLVEEENVRLAREFSQENEK